LGIAYKPYRASGPRCIRSALKELDNQSFGRRERNVVVLQSSHYFHTFGSFHVIPTRAVANDRDKNWISFWRALVRHKWPKLNRKQEDEKIKYVKNEICVANDEKFTISDGVLKLI